MLTRVTRWADGHPLVRALVLTSSRANPAGAVDLLSDYDLVLAASDTAHFESDDNWLSDAYGPLLVGLDPPPSRGPGSGRFNRLVIHRDGVKFDWNVWPLEELVQALGRTRLPDSFDVGYRALVDNDGVMQGVQAPTYTTYLPARPSRQEYDALVNEFWWETTYVAKNLWRGELLPARYSLDVVICHELLLRVLEWRVEIDHDWRLATGREGAGWRGGSTSAHERSFGQRWVVVASKPAGRRSGVRRRCSVESHQR